VVGRVVYYPYEVPIGTIMGIVGSALFLVLLLKGRERLA
jgi:iron complex transport system permease protein